MHKQKQVNKGLLCGYLKIVLIEIKQVQRITSKSD